MRHTAWSAWSGAVAVTLAISSPVAAQNTPDRRWEIEAYVGGSSFTNPTSGQAQLPPAGTVYLVEPGWPPSRQVSSWYFGDGAVLFNSARLPVQSTVSIAALDPVLTRAGTEHERGLSLGFRVARAMNDRLNAEFSFDGSLGHVRMANEMHAGIEAASDGFERAFDSLAFIAASDSRATIQRTGGRHFSASGALNVNVLTGHRWTPYATIGGGIVSSHGALPSATLVGEYQIVDEEIGTVVVDDTDRVDIRYQDNASLYFLLGGGFKFEVTRRFGIRGDIRFNIKQNNGSVVIDAMPSHAGDSFYSLTLIGRGASMVFASPGNPRQPSLSGLELTGFETFTGSGYQVQTAVTFGYFVRF